MQTAIQEDASLVCRRLLCYDKNKRWESKHMKKDIVELRHQLQKIESDKLYLEECIERLHEVESALRQAEKQLKKETRDVEKLNTASVASILAFFAKDKEERLVKEEQEALQAALHVRQLQENAKALRQDMDACELNIVQEELVRKQLAECELAEAIQHSPYGEALREQKQLVDAHTQRLKEIQEALEAGYLVLDQLKNALRSLDSASSWGFMDIAGGGILSTAMKHSAVDKAQKKIALLKINLYKFQKEVQDVQGFQINTVKLSDGTVAMDYLFDNIFTNMFVQSKIRESEKSLQQAKRRIDQIMDSLLQERQHTQQQLEREQAAYERMCRESVD